MPLDAGNGPTDSWIMNMKLQWLMIPQPKGKSRVAKWKRCIAVDQNQEIWVPAIYSGHSEMVTFLCLSWEADSKVFLDGKHIYVKLSWLRKEYKHPRNIDLYNKIESKVQHFLTTPD